MNEPSNLIRVARPSLIGVMLMYALAVFGPLATPSFAQTQVAETICERIEVSGHRALYRDFLIAHADRPPNPPGGLNGANGHFVRLAYEHEATVHARVGTVVARDPLFYTISALLDFEDSAYGRALSYLEISQRLLDDPNDYDCDDRPEIISAVRFVRALTIFYAFDAPDDFQGLLALARNTRMLPSDPFINDRRPRSKTLETHAAFALVFEILGETVDD